MARAAVTGFVFMAFMRKFCPAAKLIASPTSEVMAGPTSGFIVPDDINDQLWAGEDLPRDSAITIMPKMNKSLVMRDVGFSQDAVKQIVLLGPMDSGTHLMSWLLSQNYPDHMDVACGMTYEGCRYLWKHSADIGGVYRILEETIGKDLSETVVIAMVRTPIAQIVGWKKDPWDLADCVDKAWKDMGNKCHAPLLASKPSDHQGLASSGGGSLDFPTTMGVYNRYLQLYQTLKSDGRFKLVEIVPFEDLVLTPKVVLYKLAKTLRWGASWHTHLPQVSEKGAQGLSRQQAINKILGRDFVKDAKKALPFLCPHLNRTLVSDIKEGTWVDKNPEVPASATHPYTFDCRNYIG